MFAAPASRPVATVARLRSATPTNSAATNATGKPFGNWSPSSTRRMRQFTSFSNELPRMRVAVRCVRLRARTRIAIGHPLLRICFLYEVSSLLEPLQQSGAMPQLRTPIHPLPDKPTMEPEIDPESQMDGLNCICPYCLHAYQVEAEDYDEAPRKETCHKCGKVYETWQNFDVTHYTRPIQ